MCSFAAGLKRLKPQLDPPPSPPCSNMLKFAAADILLEPTDETYSTIHLMEATEIYMRQPIHDQLILLNNQ